MTGLGCLLVLSADIWVSCRNWAEAPFQHTNIWLMNVEIAGIWRWERLSHNHPNQLHGSGVVLITIHLC